MHPVLDAFRNAAAVGRYSAGLATLLLVVGAGLPTPSHAQAPGYVSVVFAKAGLVVGAGGGRGVLTYRGRDYPFRVSGLSVGLTARRLCHATDGTRFGLARTEGLFRHLRRCRAPAVLLLAALAGCN